MEIYKLLIYLKDKERLFLIDRILDDDLEYLNKMAEERKSSNCDYVTIVGSYKIESAILI